MIVMVVINSNQDIVISAGGVFGLVHETFVTVSFSIPTPTCEWIRL